MKKRAKAVKKSKEAVEALFESLQNPTKMSVILLIIEKGKLTVTQMAESIKVSRANLYHFVSELVKDELLSEPVSVVKGNYVEKYYSLNEQTWKKITGHEQSRRIAEISLEDLRSVFRSYFLSMSLQFRLYAQEMERIAKDDLDRIRDEVKNHNIVLSYTVMGDERYKFLMSELKKLEKKIEDKKSWSDKEAVEKISKHHNRLVIVALPSTVFPNITLP